MKYDRIPAIGSVNWLELYGCNEPVVDDREPPPPSLLNWTVMLDLSSDSSLKYTVIRERAPGKREHMLTPTGRWRRFASEESARDAIRAAQ